MARFILEIGMEEMPARFLPGLQENLSDLLTKALTEARVDFGPVECMATPRRLMASIVDLAETQSVSDELLMGPPEAVAFKDGQPTKAALGFAKGQGIDLADAFIEETDKGRYLAARKRVGGGKTFELLPDVCLNAISRLPFPKRMRWGDKDFGFGRPIRWLLALFDDQVVPFGFAGMESGRATRGHRVMGFGPFEVATAADYFDIIRDKAKVMLSPEERRATVREQAEILAQEVGGRVVWNEDLMDEVSGLVEYPKVVLGRYDASFLEVPREALITCMESHQKCFAVEGPDGALMPLFLATLNLEPKDLALVRKGWERVLKARLEDARFFWKTDTARDFDFWLGKLDNVVFLGPLGSMGDKSRRLEHLAGWLAKEVDPSLEAAAKRAGRLAKADLVTEMVGEFDNLQGIMGGIHAQRKGEGEVVGQAVYEHYLPAGPDSPVPSTLAGALLSMADKADTLAGCFGLNMVPTGANDPYALRRAALGICRCVLERKLRLNLTAFLAQAIAEYGELEWKSSPAETLPKLVEFFAQRLRSFFAGEHSTLAIEAAVSAGVDDMYALKLRLEALDAFTREPDFNQAVLTFKRAGNIIRKQGQEAGVELSGAYDATLLREPQEQALAQALAAMIPRFDELWAKDDFAALLGLLRELRPVVDAFFDNVMVMCEDEALRNNRLNLLMALVSRLGRLADFSALQI